METAVQRAFAAGGIWDDRAVAKLVGGAPGSWRAMKLQDVCTKITDGTHKTPNYQPHGIRFISIKNIRPFQPINWESYQKYISADEHRTC